MRRHLHLAWAHLLLGLHSNIRVCCVAEWVVRHLVRRHRYVYGRPYERFTRPNALSAYLTWRYQAEYIECTLCQLLGRLPAPLHYCDDHCAAPHDARFERAHADSCPSTAPTPAP